MNLAKRRTTAKNKVNNFPMPPKSIFVRFKTTSPGSSFTEALRLDIYY